MDKNFQNTKRCNCCGEVIKKEHNIESSVVTIEIPWGYFSNKDGEIHKIILCESCYDKWIQTFKIPIEIKENVELIYLCDGEENKIC